MVADDEPGRVELLLARTQKIVLAVLLEHFVNKTVQGIIMIKKMLLTRVLMNLALIVGFLFINQVRKWGGELVSRSIGLCRNRSNILYMV